MSCIQTLWIDSSAQLIVFPTLKVYKMSLGLVAEIEGMNSDNVDWDEILEFLKNIFGTRT